MKLKFPKYVWISFTIMFIIHCSTYFLSQAFTVNTPHRDFTIQGFDDKVPFLSIFVVPYILAFVFWAIGPFVISKVSKEHYFNWIFGALIHYIICFIIYTVCPTTITRPVVENETVFDYLVNLIYVLDRPERPTNLFPSIHCSLSILCYVGVMGKKEIPLWYRVSALVMAILVCLSTQFIKQHYIVDLISAFIIVVISYSIATKLNLYKIFFKKETQENGN